VQDSSGVKPVVAVDSENDEQFDQAGVLLAE
jgi:hypothetical protein